VHLQMVSSLGVVKCEHRQQPFDFSLAVLASMSSLLSIPYLLFIIRFTSCIPFNIFLFLFRLYKLDDVCTKQ